MSSKSSQEQVDKLTWQNRIYHEDLPLTPLKRAVLQVIANAAKPDGTRYYKVSYKKIAAKTGYNHDVVGRTVRKLREEGWIDYSNFYESPKKQSPNDYYVNIAKLMNPEIQTLGLPNPDLGSYIQVQGNTRKKNGKHNHESYQHLLDNIDREIAKVEADKDREINKLLADKKYYKLKQSRLPKDKSNECPY